ncbi:GNAT family N-acetyltransferase [Granulosicoccus antarcticus]|uniref:Putative N-acetyltransferase YycN n=1 Tax=Granulosicoccus antarcticus IMCC3135 TaxID=1192854 RepID=A0A2Z2NIP9_9GAMM|nr:GNAT family N-acetyltransferase [Granulosicoccus antarcticus]ASJ71232.1 putative N-acetyltransferase YycN [Granulosicoccus antarcticus IMCC3135]
MISYRAMLDEEYDDYLSYFICDYSAEIASSYKLSLEAATEIAKREVARDLPSGPGTKGQFLYCIVNTVELTNNHIGYIWYSREHDADQIFVCDFYILPTYQNQGLGKLALAELDTHLSNSGVRQIRLRVAIENRIALHVYESSGYRATGINMFREIGKAE